MGNKHSRVIIIGSGFSGLSAAVNLAAKGYDVTVLEKNDCPGGRARQWKQDGFIFDMGPSWYWMPEVFSNFFEEHGSSVEEHYELLRLDPAYQIFYPEGKKLTIPASYEALRMEFERLEPGSAKKLDLFMDRAGYKYRVAMADYVHKVSDSITEFFDLRLLIKAFQLELFSSVRSEVRKLFKHPHLQSLLEFPVLFLGSTASNTPAMYSMMNYADLKLGTWYPMGGFYRIIEGMVRLAEQKGATIRTNCEVSRIETAGGAARFVHLSNGEKLRADVVIAAGDYRHVEQELLAPEDRYYKAEYWENRTMSPSSLIFYLGLNTKVPGLLHHSLFFDESLDQHAAQIYDRPSWPDKPLFYVCAPSKTDPEVAPEGCENLFVLMPLAPGIQDDDATREKYFDMFAERIRERTGTDIREHIVVKRSYAITDFEKDYHSFKGNAYGLANTLMQTAVLKPKMISPKVRNLFFTGQLTVPGPGVPPAIISGRMAAGLVAERFPITRKAASYV